jgi:hypothetical protein
VEPTTNGELLATPKLQYQASLVPSAYAGTPRVATVDTFPTLEGALFRIQTTGTATRTHIANIYREQFGASGVWVHSACVEGVVLRDQNGGVAIGPGCPPNGSNVGGGHDQSGIAVVHGKTDLVLQGNTGGTWGCSPNTATPPGPCFTYGGQFTVTLERVAAEPKLTVGGHRLADGVSMSPDHNVTVRAGTLPAQVGGHAVPVRTVDGPQFLPDTGGSRYPCGPATYPTSCTFQTSVGGTMVFGLLVNGYRYRASIRVPVVQPDLRLTAAPRVVSRGDSVTFTASERYGTAFAVQSWSWLPDTAPGRTAAAACGRAKTCRIPVHESGRMVVRAYMDVYNALQPYQADTVRIYAGPARLKVTGPASVPEGQTATFTASVTGGTAPLQITGWAFRDSATGATTALPCGAATTCAATITRSGDVVANGTLAGAATSGSTSVTAVPCPTGDPVLDDPGVRRGLRAALDSSGVALPPLQRKEVGGYVYRRPDGSSFVVFARLAGSTACLEGVDQDGAPPASRDGAQLIGRFHTHVVRTGELLSGCLDFRDPNDVSTVYTKDPFPAPPESFGAASNDRMLVSPGRSHWVINVEGDVYRLDPPARLDPVPVPPSQRWRWDKGPGNACTWGGTLTPP